MSTRTCNIVNAIDKKQMILCTNWSNENLIITIMRNGMTPLYGSITMEKLVEASEHFKISKDEYLEDMKNELCGRNSEILFYLKDNTFSWKKKMWTRGRIVCKPITDTINLSELLLETLTRYSTIQEALRQTKENNELLEKRVREMENILEVMTKIKNNMEDELCKKFLVLLNSKKKKIRELQEKIKQCTRDPVYDASTDESDNENSNNKKNKDVKAKKEIKENNEGKDEEEVEPVSKKMKTDINANAESFDEFPELSIFANITKAIKNSCLLLDNTLTSNANDSDESFELRLEATQVEMPKKHCSMLNVTDEDPEEDLFSS